MPCPNCASSASITGSSCDGAPHAGAGAVDRRRHGCTLGLWRIRRGIASEPDPAGHALGCRDDDTRHHSRHHDARHDPATTTPATTTPATRPTTTASSTPTPTTTRPAPTAPEVATTLAVDEAELAELERTLDEIDSILADLEADLAQDA